MKADFHPPKWFMYAAIVTISAIVGLLMMVTVSRTLNERSAIEKAKREQAIQEAERQADSVYKEAEEKVEEVVEKHVADSLAYVQTTLTIQKFYTKKKNELDAIYNSIDTITDNGSFGSFSVRQMLSDSACKLHR